MIGKTVSHYEILEKLGEGGMGIVYKARDNVLDRIVALKFVTVAASLQEDLKDRLIREARALAAINHPNICTIFDFCESEGHPCIVMEYVEGEELNAVIRDQPLPQDKVLDIGIQIAKALDAAHAKGIIHRDLKADNIMLDRSGRVRVMDFGLAKLTMGSKYTRSGMTLGTAAYMSPEQAQGSTVDKRSDLYSLGVILYQMITGRLPFVADHELAVMYSIVNEPPVPPGEYNPDMDPVLEAMILKAMVKESEARYADAGEMADGMTRIKKGEPDQKSSMAAGKDVAALRQLSKNLFRWGVPAGVVIAALIFSLFRWGPFSQRAKNEQLAWQFAEQGRAYIKANEPVLAVSALRRSLEYDPGMVKVWNLLGTVYINTGRTDSAFHCIQKAIELDDTYGPAHYNLGYAFENQGSFTEAVKAYNEAIKCDPELTEAYSTLGNVLMQLGRHDEAIRILNRALEQTPQSEILYIVKRHLGEAHLKSNRPSLAVQWLRDSDTARPDQPETHRLLAEAFEAEGQIDSSIVYWRKYAGLETDRERSQEALERIRALSR
jgi:tetratricopeptide (TPR) repeat protein